MKNVLEFLEESAKRFPDKTAFADENMFLTYSCAVEKAKSAGTYIFKETGFDIVASLRSIFFNFLTIFKNRMTLGGAQGRSVFERFTLREHVFSAGYDIYS